MAGDDVPKKKPDPSIYKIAAERLQVNRHSNEQTVLCAASRMAQHSQTGAGMLYIHRRLVFFQHAGWS